MPMHVECPLLGCYLVYPEYQFRTPVGVGNLIFWFTYVPVFCQEINHIHSIFICCFVVKCYKLFLGRQIDRKGNIQKCSKQYQHDRLFIVSDNSGYR